MLTVGLEILKVYQLKTVQIAEQSSIGTGTLIGTL